MLTGKDGYVTIQVGYREGLLLMKLRKVCRVIKLYSGEYVRVDDEDYERLNQYRWCLLKSKKWCYAVRYERGKTVFMHREILGITNPKEYVDHKDHDGLNNQKKNLRKSDNRFNQYNVGKKTTSKQKYKCIRQKEGKWQVRIRIPEGRRIERSANTEEEAVKLYNDLVIKYHGEFAYLQEYIPD